MLEVLIAVEELEREMVEPADWYLWPKAQQIRAEV
jgi:hypothetical protein